MTLFRQGNWHKAESTRHEISLFARIKSIFQRMELGEQTLLEDPHDKYQDWRFDWDRWGNSNNERGRRSS